MSTDMVPSLVPLGPTGKLANPSVCGSYRLSPPELLPTQSWPRSSTSRLRMKLSGREPAASGFLAYVCSWYPSQRSRFDWVPNHRNPCVTSAERRVGEEG